MSFAFVFPGQGSQALKMMDGLKDLAVVKEVFNKAKAILGVDLLAMLNEDTPENINQTINTQPLMLVSGYATYLAWISSAGRAPDIVAGHSLGEWTALVASQVLSIEDAIKLVRLRAEVMQSAVPAGEGFMAAVLGLDDEQVDLVCKEVSKDSNGVVSAVNFNSPGQVVIAGESRLCEEVSNKLKDAGAKKVQRLSVSVPAHCSLMQSAADKLKKAMEDIQFNSPVIKIVQNVDGIAHDDATTIKELLIKQVYAPVLWTKSIQYIVAQGIKDVVECGPGKVLSGLNKRIDSSIVSYNLHTKEDLENPLFMKG